MQNISAFVFQLNSASSLLSLGSLIQGIPSEKLVTIAPQQILETSHDPEFVQNILAAPEIVQVTFVNQVHVYFKCQFE